MNSFDIFFKENRSVRDCYFAEVCNDIKTEKGNVVKWKLRPLDTSEEEIIRQDSMENGPAGLRLNMNKYIARLISASVIYPNLYDAALQDSYHCKTPEELLKQIVNVPGEYSALAKLVQEKNGFKSLNDEVNTAKN